MLLPSKASSVGVLPTGNVSIVPPSKCGGFVARAEDPVNVSSSADAIAGVIILAAFMNVPLPGVTVTCQDSSLSTDPRVTAKQGLRGLGLEGRPPQGIPSVFLSIFQESFELVE